MLFCAGVSGRAVGHREGGGEVSRAVLDGAGSEG